MQRAVILCEGERIEVADVLAAERIGLSLSSSASAVPITQRAKKKDEERPMAERPDEKQRIVAALEKMNWIVSGNRGAARLLGMSAQTLRYRMRKYGIQWSKNLS